jgi:hypothetical protein
MITVEQLKAGRRLLRWSALKVVSDASVNQRAVVDFEIYPGSSIVDFTIYSARSQITIVPLIHGVLEVDGVEYATATAGPMGQARRESAT